MPRQRRTRTWALLASAWALVVVHPSLQASPASAKTHARLSAACWTQLAQGRAAKALSACELAAAQVDSDEVDVVRAGHAWLLQGDMERARAHYRTFLASPIDEVAWRRGPLRDLDRLIRTGGRQAARWRQTREWLVAGRSTLARATSELAEVQALKKQRQFDPSLEMARRVFDAVDPLLPPDAEMRTDVSNSLLYLQEQTFRYDEMLAFCRQGLERLKARSDSDLKQLYVNGEAAALQAMGRYREAAAAWQRVIEINERADGADDPGLMWLLNVQAEALLEADDIEAAQPMLQRAVALLHNPKAKIRDASVTLALMARCLQALDQPEEALAAAQAAVALAEQVTEEDAAAPVPALAALADVLMAQDSVDESIDENRRALALAEQTLGAMHPITARRKERLAVALLASGELAQARDLMEQAFDTAMRTIGPDHPDTAVRRALLSRLRDGSPAPAPALSTT